MRREVGQPVGTNADVRRLWHTTTSRSEVEDSRELVALLLAADPTEVPASVVESRERGVVLAGTAAEAEVAVVLSARAALRH